MMPNLEPHRFDDNPDTLLPARLPDTFEIPQPMDWGGSTGAGSRRLVVLGCAAYRDAVSFEVRTFESCPVGVEGSCVRPGEWPVGWRPPEVALLDGNAASIEGSLYLMVHCDGGVHRSQAMYGVRPGDGAIGAVSFAWHDLMLRVAWPEAEVGRAMSESLSLRGPCP